MTLLFPPGHQNIYGSDMATTQVQLAPTSTKMLLYTKLAPPKQPKRRSRGGCTYWNGTLTSESKEKKKKCDEARPKCARCVEHGVECNYEPVKPRQRRRREVPSTTSKPELHLIGHRRLSDVSEDGPERVKYEHDHGFFGTDALTSPTDDSFLLSPIEGGFDGFSPTPFSPPAYVMGGQPSADDSALKDDDDEDGQPSPASTNSVVPSSSQPLSSSLAMVGPCPVGSPVVEFCTPAFAEFSDRPNRRALVDHFCNVLSHLIVLREETGNPFQQLVLPLTRRDSPVTYAILALASAHLEYRGIENPEKSLHFHSMAIRGVAQMIQNGGTKTRRNEILAAIMLLVYYECLVQKGHQNIVTGHLKGALTIMDTVPNPADKTSIFLERAFRFYDVITALSNGTAPLSTTPAPECLQPLSPLGAPPVSPLNNVDTLLGMSTTLWPIIHRLAGLRALKNELSAAVSANESPTRISSLRAELEAAARDIEAALLQWEPQLPPDFVPDKLDVDDDVSSVGGGSSRSASPLNDPSSPVSRKSPPAPAPLDLPSPPPLPTSFSSHSPQPLPISPLVSSIPRPNVSYSQNQVTILSSIHHNALAYRHASLVHLYRATLSRPRSDPDVQRHARLALRHCAATARRGGPVAALLWPLFVAACEATTEADRELADQTFAEVERRQGMRNIERAWGILREVWKRRGKKEDDDGVKQEDGQGEQEEEEEGEEVWRRVSREMGVSIVFG